MTWDKAVWEVMKNRVYAARVNAVVKKIEKLKLRKLGPNPYQAVYQALQNGTRGPNPLYEKVGRAQFKPLNAAGLDNEIDDVLPEEDDEDEGTTAAESLDFTNIIFAYGIYWRRDDVRWTGRHSRLVGKQFESSDPVDFSDQIGIYVLYDHMGAVYVGRALRDSLFRRLKAHTKDRLSARWAYFSWFGLKPLAGDQFSMGEAPDQIPSNSMLMAMEAVLIEAMEPRLNRKAGDHVSKTEYLQYVDT